MKNNQLKQFLLKQGLKDIGGDETGDMFENDHVCVFLYKEDDKRDVSFGHSEDGYYSIENATLEQIQSVISIFKVAIFK